MNFTLKRTSNFAVRLRPTVDFIIAKQSLAIEKIIFINRQRILETVNLNVFDLLNTQVSIPVSLSTKSWDFEFGNNLNLPNAVLKERKLKTTGFFSLSVGYLFDLHR